MKSLYYLPIYQFYRYLIPHQWQAIHARMIFLMQQLSGLQTLFTEGAGIAGIVH